MIRTARHKHKDYIIIETTFQIKEGDKVVNVPLHIHLDGTDLSHEDYHKVMKGANRVFNHTIAFSFDKPIKESKTWWKKIFN